ncbi:hypothetical protein SDC9_116266 [bioreactor metagenome]|uniref:Uncharacterized protein n=1 Tax=bioreactor metagenome TaxID=1076179 RepID=A0A645BXE1_9ZZZZ
MSAGRLVRLRGERCGALSAPGDVEVVDPGVVQGAGEPVGESAGRLLGVRLEFRVAPDRPAHQSGQFGVLGPRRVRGRFGAEVGGQGGGDDVAGGRVAVHRGVVRAAVGVQRHVGADHRVDPVLDGPQFALAVGGPDRLGEFLPRGGAGQVQRQGCVGEAVEQPDQPQHLLAHPLEGSVLTLLVLQRAAEPEQGDQRRMRVDLDGPAGAPRGRVDVEVEAGGQACPARDVVQLGAAGVRRMGAGFETGEVTVEGRLAGPVAGGVGDDQRSVDRHQAFVVEVRRQGGCDRVVGGGRGQMDQRPGVVEDGETGTGALAPGEVDTDEVHVTSILCAGCSVRSGHPTCRRGPGGSQPGAELAAAVSGQRSPRRRSSLVRSVSSPMVKRLTIVPMPSHPAVSR